MLYLGLLLAALAVLSFAYVLLPSFVRLCGKTIGNHVRQKSQQRKSLLLARAASDKKQHQELSAASTTVDDEWEKIDKSQSRSISDITAPQDQPNREWTGVVGFFHPFWYATDHNSDMKISP